MKILKSYKKRRIILIITTFLLIIGIGAFLLIRNTDVVENVKKETARLFVYEYIPNQKLEITERLAYSCRDSIYDDFRKQFRFHYQTIGVAQFEDSSRIILISEPPPYFEIDSIPSIFRKFTHRVETRQHKIGYDGKITDIIILLANATTENTNNLVKALSKELYLSDYKPCTTDLPVKEKRKYYSDEHLDYQITLYEFNEWFLEYEEPFLMLDDTNRIETIHSIFDEQKRGVFFSQLPGFVAWALPKKSDLAEHTESIRQFTLDADLVLGALADSATLVIIGREREAPLYELPPLNVETILLLASITEKDLSQSLDINDFMAGKMNNGHDWCPTYLSKELENTEFGHLLTITDILLKNWSESGTIQEAHYRYPRPRYYPFDKPLFKKLGLSELVYNWNTANAMYAIDMENVTIYTLNRTGSLPVSYFNSQERSVSIGRRYENQAYNYFATIGNTDLARVVQYTAIYQLFIDNEITYSGDIHTAFPKNKPYLLLKPSRDFLTILKELPNEKMSLIADSISIVKFNLFHQKQVDKQMKEMEEKYQFTYTKENREHIYQNVQKDNQTETVRQFQQVKNMLKSLSEEDFERLAKYLAYPRGTRIKTQEDYSIYLKAKQVNQLLRIIGKNYLYLFDFDLNKVKNYYVNNLASSSAKYLKTPSVIITFNDFTTTGGHNLSSKISRVNSLTNYKKSGTATSTSEKPVSKESSSPVATSSPTSGTKPVASSKPSTTSSSGSTAKAPSTTKSSTPSSTAKPSTRPRSEVISSGTRTHRGL